jgi:MFS family permease
MPARSLAARLSSTDLGPRFVKLLWARGISSLGDGLIYVALPLLAASVTKDPRAIAGVAIATQLPWLFFGLVVGVLADRYGARRTTIVTEAVRTLALFALAAVVAATRPRWR